MGISIAKRILTYVLVLFGLSILIFVIARVMPGDVARMALGPRTPEATVEALREEMHLRDPIYTQYFYWLGDIFKGDFGVSIISKRPVLDDIRIYLPATMELVLLSAVFTAFFGIVLGVLSAKYSGKWPDAIIRIFSYFGVVAPAFFWAVLVMLLFAYLIPILPSSGRIGPGLTEPAHVTGMYILDYLLAGNTAGAFDALKHILMPAVVLSFGGISQAARITRTSMTENMMKPYASAERAYGIPENKILFKYLLRPSLNSTISVMALDIAGAFAGAFLVEQIFNYPGLSRYCLQAMLNKDVFAVSAVVMVFGVIFIVMNFVTDIIISVLDPRVRLAARGEA
ncbi:MAG: ABC transporter permease [Clostridiales Family XIII bacterium]|jgi:peptide/nickel transport system permease protein|nr:ABC transporter permease [Clostridiales Family XIII bacterium]